MVIVKHMINVYLSSANILSHVQMARCRVRAQLICLVFVVERKQCLHENVTQGDFIY